MTTYRNIHGRSIQAVSTDPTESVAEGQVWYNTSSDTFKSVVSTEAWSSAAGLITGVYGSMQFGLQTAGVAASGSAGPGPTTATQEYNGSGWSSGGNVGSQRYRGGAGGTETAGVIFGGESPGGDSTATEEYNGSSWTNGGAMTKARRTTGFGIQTAASAVGGYDNANKLATVEDYNGTSWTSGTNLPLSGTADSGSGLTSSARVAGGIYGPGSTHPPSSPQTFNNNLGWDGTSWSDDTAIPVNRYNNSGFGTSSDDYYTAAGRNPSPAILNTTIQWNGSAWSDAPNLATARYNGQGINGTPSAFYFAGGNPGEYTNTEEFNKSANVITAGAWATGGALSTARNSMFTGPVGTQDAGYAAGGATPGGRSNATEEYNGSSWTTVNTVPSSLSGRGGAGTQTAGLLFGGNPSPATVTTTDEYDGTNYSSGGALNNARGYGPIAAGTQTAALAGGGYNPPVGNVTVTEYYNGTAWTAQPNANPSTYGGASGGTQAAAWMVSGLPPSTPKQAFEWDGSSWTAGGAYATDKVLNLFGGGPQTAAWMCGGSTDPGLKNFTNHYNGTAWSTAPSLGTARSGYCQGGTQAAGLIAGGTSTEPSTRTTATEEFTGETTALNVKTLTQS